MRTFTIAAKSTRELVCNPLLPSLAVILGPFFVALIWLFFPSGGSTSYPVTVVSPAAGPDQALQSALITSMQNLRYDTEAPILEVRLADSLEAARADVESRRSVAYVDLPAGIATKAALAASNPQVGVPVTLGGDLSNPQYPIAAIMVHEAISTELNRMTARVAVVELTEVALGGSATRTEFESYVPGVLIFAIGMIVFTAASSVAQEVERGTLHRLVRTPLKAREFLAGITIVQAVLGLAAGAASLGTAAAVGFRPAGSVPLILLVWLLTSLSVIGMGLIVGAFCRTVTQAFLLANFPFGVNMFLSGSMFPVRGLVLFSVGGQDVNVLDILPPRHAVNALNSLVTYGSTDIGYELSMLSLLSLGFFALGAWVFSRRHLRNAE